MYYINIHRYGATDVPLRRSVQFLDYAKVV